VILLVWWVRVLDPGERDVPQLALPAFGTVG
jgi:hypothetical protein